MSSVAILRTVCAGDGLIKSGPRRYLAGQVSGQPSVELGRAGLEVGGEAAILHGQVVVLLLVHFLVDDILLSYPERTSCALLMDLRRASGGLEPGLETSVATTGSGNIGSKTKQSDAERHGKTVGRRRR